LLSDLAEVLFLEHTLARASEPGQHAVVIELYRAALHHERRRFSTGNPGLLEWLARAYTRARGRFDTAAVLLEDGDLRAAAGVTELAELLERRPRGVALRLIGPGIADLLTLETGSHVRRAAGAGPEIIEVRAVRGVADPLRHLSERGERERAFELALESEGAPPAGSQRLLPIVRSLRFDPGPAPSRPSRASVEDYRFSWARSRLVRELDELLVDFWLLGAGHVAARARAGGPA
jgi:hypothetical protein